MNQPLTECQPESWSMLKDSVHAAQEAIRAGIENTQELLADHDVRLGRTTRSTRHTAERLEGEIRQMQAALDSIQGPDAKSP
jgi:CRISPR/Cas system-associated endonuclease Cas1